MQTHSSYKNFKCQRCNKSFALKSYLNKHYESSCFKDSSSNSLPPSPASSSDSRTSSPGETAPGFPHSFPYMVSDYSSSNDSPPPSGHRGPAANTRAPIERAFVGRRGKSLLALQ